MKIFLSIIVLSVLTFSPVAFAQQEEYTCNLTITDEVATERVLQFGVDRFASDGIDLTLNEGELPPMPPAGNFEARFILPENNFSGSLSSYVDYRTALENPFTGDVVYRLHYQKSASANSITIRYNLPAKVTGVLKDIVTGTLINVAISGTGEYKVTNPASFNKLRFEVHYDNVITGIDNAHLKELQFAVHGNYPNPFNPSTVISYEIPEASPVTISVYNSAMEYVETITHGTQSAGRHQASWSAAGRASGVYFYAVRAAGRVAFGKMMLLK